MANAYFYILCNSTRTLLYVGATKNLIERLSLHEKGRGAVFTKKYHVKFLVYFEEFDDCGSAFQREKQIKNWRKDWKWNLIKQTNPDLVDLSDDLT